MQRGSLVAVAVQGDFGKPRPAVVVQSDALAGTDSVLVCLLATTRRDAALFRLDVAPDAANGLHAPSQVMVDKVMAVRRDRCSAPFGRLDDVGMLALNRLLALVMGLAD